MSESLESVGEVSISQHPWRRYFARSIDISVISTLTVIPYMQLTDRINLPFVESMLNSFIVMLLFFIIETILLTLVGTTLGKWILNIQLIAIDDSGLKFTNALRRSFFVYMSGQAFGLPVISLFAVLDSYDKLKENGSTIWDEKAGTKVTFGEVGLIRIIIAILLLISPVLISTMIYV